MNLTGDQRYFLTILGQTGFIRPDQVLPLLRINEPGKEPGHAEAMLRRLRYLGLLSRSSEGLICLPEFRDSAPDWERLFVLDILLPLERMEQHRQITLARSHYFVLQQGRRLKFYKGGEAGKQPRQ